MVGWERKLGLIVPSWNPVNEYEVQRAVIPAMSVHTMRIKVTSETEEDMVWMAGQVPSAAKLLAHADVDVICYGCMASGFIKGVGCDREIIRDMEAATGIPGTTAATAVVDALQALGVQRVSVASPYAPWVNERLRDYLKAYGMDAVAVKSLAAQAPRARFRQEENAALVAEVDRPETQAVLITCSNLRTLEVIETVEHRLGKAVITSNMAALWKMLRLLGDRRDVPMGGRLFREA